MENAIPPCGFNRFSKWAFLGLFTERLTSTLQQLFFSVIKMLERCTKGVELITHKRPRMHGR